MRNEQDIEDERMMNYRYDKDYSGVYKILIIIGAILIGIGVFSEIYYFASTATVNAIITKETKVSGANPHSQYEVAYEVNNESYEAKVDDPNDKYNANDAIKVRYKVKEPKVVAHQEHILNALLDIVGVIFCYLSIKKYKYDKKIETSVADKE